MSNVGNRLKGTAHNCASCHRRLRGQPGQRFCVVVAHNVDQQLRNLAAKSWVFPNECTKCGEAKYHHQLANGKEVRQCKACRHMWGKILRTNLPIKSPVSRPADVEKRPLCNTCLQPGMLVFGDLGHCLRCGHFTDLLMLGTCSSKQKAKAAKVVKHNLAAPKVAKQAYAQAVEERLQSKSFKKPLPTPRSIFNAAAPVPMPRARPGPSGVAKSGKTSAKPKLATIQEHRKLSPPVNTKKLVNQQLSGTFGQPQPRKSRDSLAPRANKRVIRAIVEDNNGQSDVLGMRKAYNSPQVNGSSPSKEDFRFVRNLRLSPHLFIPGEGAGVWVEVPALLKSPHLEYLDIAWLAAMGKTQEQRLRLALIMGKIANQQRLNKAMRKTSPTKKQ